MMSQTKREDRLKWAAGVAETFLEQGERGDGNTKRGVRLGVLANRVSRRYRLTDAEAIDLARRAFEVLLLKGYAVFKDGVYHRTMKLARKEPHVGLDLVMRAGQWRVLGYKLPADVADHTNVKDVYEGDDGVIQYEVVRD